MTSGLKLLQVQTYPMHASLAFVGCLAKEHVAKDIKETTVAATL